MNSIIGNNFNILPITMKECTNNIFIIKNSSNGIKFCESKIKENKNGNYFEDKETFIELKNDEIKNNEKLTEIKEKIKEKNDKNKFKIFTIYIPIENFEKISENENIELIDLPGIKESLINEEFEKLDLSKLINMSDGFIFSFNAINIEDNTSQFIFSTIINDIKMRKDSFNFENCLFNLNFIDKKKKNQIEETKVNFEKDIKKNLNKILYNGSFIDKIRMKENISSFKFNISYISNENYRKYQNQIYQIESLEFVKENNLKSLNDIHNYLDEEYNNLYDDNISNIENEKINKILEKINNLELNDKNNNNELKEKIAKFILSILNNKYEIKLFKNSYAKTFFDEFKKEINSAKKNNKKLKEDKIIIHFVKLLFRLFYIDSLCSDENKIKIFHKNIEDKIKQLEEILINFNEKTDSIFNEKFNYFNKIKEDIKKDKYFSEEIKENLREKIKEIVNNLEKKLDSLKNDFCYDCQIIISDILNDDNSTKILNLISNIINRFDLIDFNNRKDCDFSNLPSVLRMIVNVIIMPYSIMKDIYYFLNELDSYFDEINKYFNELKKIFKNNLEKIKEKYKSELKNFKEISINEIKKLKVKDFQKNFLNLINSLNDENYLQ